MRVAVTIMSGGVCGVKDQLMISTGVLPFAWIAEANSTDAFVVG